MNAQNNKNIRKRLQLIIIGKSICNAIKIKDIFTYFLFSMWNKRNAVFFFLEQQTIRGNKFEYIGIVNINGGNCMWKMRCSQAIFSGHQSKRSKKKKKVNGEE
jgi:hypothetical protein